MFFFSNFFISFILPPSLSAHHLLIESKIDNENAIMFEILIYLMCMYPSRLSRGFSTPPFCVFDAFENTHRRTLDPSENGNPSTRFPNPMGQELDTQKVPAEIFQSFDSEILELSSYRVSSSWPIVFENRVLRLPFSDRSSTGRNPRTSFPAHLGIYLWFIQKKNTSIYICERTKDEYDIRRIKKDITVRGANIGGYLDDIDFIDKSSVTLHFSDYFSLTKEYNNINGREQPTWYPNLLSPNYIRAKLSLSSLN